MHPASIQGAYVTLEDLLRLRLATRTTEREAFNARLGASGARLSRFRGRGIEFTEVRSYQPGDDVRAIDWKVTARRMTPHTKVYTEERERPELIVLDQTRSMFFGTGTRLKSVTAAETAALLAWQYLARGDRVGGMVLGEQGHTLVKPKRRLAATLHLLRAIVAANRALHARLLEPAEPLARSIEEATRLAPTGHGIHIISDFAGETPQLKPALQRLARHNQVRLVHVYDEFEATPPAGRFPLVRLGTRLIFDTTSQAARQGIRTAFDARIHALRALCQSTGCRLLSLPNQATLLDRAGLDRTGSEGTRHAA